LGESLSLLETLKQAIKTTSIEIPKDWEEKIVIHSEGENTFTMIIERGGRVSFLDEEDARADSIIKISPKYVYDAITDQMEYMNIWKDLAEPHEKSMVKKGSGLKLLAIITSLADNYTINKELKNLIDKAKASLQKRQTTFL
jgi:hypothetical protein